MNVARRPPENTARVIALALGTWALTVALAGYSGAFARIGPSLFAMLVVMGVILATATYYLDVGVRASVDAIELRTLSLFNLWRIPAGVAFLAHGAAGLLPEAFARVAGWGDVAVGAMALAFIFRNAGAAGRRLQPPSPPAWGREAGSERVSARGKLTPT